MADNHNRANEPSPKRAGAWMIAFALLCVAASICYAIREYDLRSAEQVAAINGQTVEMKNQSLQKFHDEKLAAYSSVAEAASNIAALKSAGAPAAQVQDAVTHFKTLLSGPVSITSGRDVNTALALFNGALDADANAGQLQQLSLDLAHVCGNEAHDLFSAAGLPDPGATYGPDSAILGEMKEIARGPESAQAAALWLAQLDAGQYAESWKAASEYFQSTVTQDQWERKISGLRNALGSMSSRKPKSADYAEAAKGAPEGEHMVLQFDTSFAEKTNAVETVTTVPDKDGQWKVSAYSVR